MWSGQTQTQDAVTFHADKLSSATNPDQNQAAAITVTFDRYSYPVVLPNATRAHDQRPTPVPSAPPSAAASPELPQTRSDLGHFRKESVRYESNLPQYLRQVDWMNRQAVEDVHWLLGQWGAPEQLDLAVALELLSLDFIDHRVRKLAVDRLWHLSNEELLRYLLQLVQTLKVETYHDSFLAQFLIQRALQSKRIGHFLFWYMRSEVLGCLFFRQRMAVVLEAYLLGCGRDMTQRLQLQVQAVEALQTVALSLDQLLQKRDVDPQAPQWLRDLLEKCDLPSEFVLPFDPRIKVGKILLGRCKVMASKKKPMWLEFEPSPTPLSSESVGVIFKYGDDLRQDMLVIQTFVLMDSIWQDKSLDLNLVPYGCIATGYNIGMIQTVRNAVTIAAIQRSFGGSASAFKDDALFEWLKSKCPLQEMHFQTVETFVRSCAGYCVASYVLGIGDRHNDNIMVTESGNLFHIDFGHILGNWKRFLGQSRERVPFVLTPDFLYVMGRVKPKTSLYFERFKDLCLEAYLSLCSRSHLLVTLFSIMELTGIRELSEASDMRYLREVLQEGRSQEHARSHFLEQIDVCEADSWKVQANWWFHMVAGSKG
uniref:phosphatidylinositol 3-kinase n=1 Tax=Knipowitschia caucasica TaxID=637954 RepID=A0AAV2M1M4_KNICA